MCAICAGNQPHRLLHEIRNAVAQEAADDLAIWAWGALSLTAIRPTGIPNDALGIPLVRVSNGGRAPPKDSNAAGLWMRGAASFRERCIERANAYCFYTCGAYGVRAPSRGARVSENGAIHRERRMWAGVEATPGHWDTPGWPIREKPALDADPRGMQN